MSGLFKKARKKAKGVVDSLRPPLRQGRSPSPEPQASEHSTPYVGTNPSATPPLQLHVTTTISTPTPSGSSMLMPGADSAQPASSASSPVHATPSYARPSAPLSALSTTGSAIYELLATIRDASDMCLPLKAAAVGVLKIWDVCERTIQLNQEFIKHKDKLERLLRITVAHQDEAELSDSLRKRLEEIAIALQDLAYAVQAKLDRGLTSRVLQSDNDINEVKDLVDKTMSLIDVFEFEGGVRIEIGVEHIQVGVKDVKDSVGQVQDGVDEVVRVVDDLTRHLSAASQFQAAKEREEYFDRLRSSIATALDKHYVRQAVYDAQQRSGCMEGTRVDILNQIFRWIMDPKAQPIFWLGGMAGTGKTAIAWSICERVHKDDTLCLGGSFFCSRSTSSAAQRDVRCVIPTLAQLLARQSDEFAAALAAELKKDPDLGYKKVKVQVERLLRKPLAALSSSTQSVVFVVDALDECGDQPTNAPSNDNSEAHAAVSEMLEALIDFSRLAADLPIKFIVTSRPETHIRETSVMDIKVTSVLHLHTIDRIQVTNDIQWYIHNTLSKAPSTKPWFTENDVKILAERSEGLFIFAATATRYILSGGKGFRPTRLSSLVSPLHTTPDPFAVAPLDLMYSLILTEASRPDMVKADELQQILKVVAAILLARMSLSVDALAELLDLSTDYLRGCLDRLHAVVYMSEDNHDASLRTLHASFGDYLFTRAAADIRIDTTLGHNELAHGCLRRMTQDDFNFNISCSPSSHEANPEMKPDWISLSLHYACLHWAHHIQSASAQAAIEDAVNAIFRPKFLFWLEVLSVLGEVGKASGLLRIAGFTVKLPEVSRFLRDANSFVASSRAAIEWSAPHIYLSALPFAPKDSIVFQDFSSFLRGVVSVETFGIDRHGSRLVMNLKGHEKAVLSVAYSPDGRLLASGSADGTVRIWDTLTGDETMAPLQSGDGDVNCVVFTRDGLRVISGTDGKLIHLWDMRTGREGMAPLRGHLGPVWSVALSPDGQLIASGSEDKSVRLWDADTGKSIAVLTGHTDLVLSVTFSSDGHILASGSGDSTVRLWDVLTCQSQGQPLRGADSWVLSVAFSLDCRFIAAGFGDSHEIRIWNVSTGNEIDAPLKAGCSIAGLVFSPDGSHLASTDLHGVRFWDWKTGQDVTPALSGHNNSVEALSYSPDGLYIASASTDNTVRIWDAEHSQTMTQQLPSHTGSVNSVACSADGAFIVSGSTDRTIQVWNSQTAEPILPLLIGHTKAVLSVAISADGRFIASGSADRTVRLWDGKTGKSIGQPLEGHGARINAVTFSHDVRWLASASSDGTIGLWALAGDQRPTLRQLRCHYRPLSIAFSSDSQLLALGGTGGYVTLRKLSTSGSYTTSGTMRVNDDVVRSVCFSPDNCKIAAASFDRNIHIWDVETRQRLQTLKGHAHRIRAVAYSRDGERLISGSDDCTIRIWDASTGQAITVLYGHVTSIRSFAFLPDGKKFVSGAEDGTIRMCDIDSAMALSSQASLPLADMLVGSRLDDGWLVRASGERLIWLPQEYRSNIVVGRDSRTSLIATHHVVLSAGTVIHHGKEWTRCWRDAEPFKLASSS